MMVMDRQNPGLGVRLSSGEGASEDSDPSPRERRRGGQQPAQAQVGPTRQKLILHQGKGLVKLQPGEASGSGPATDPHQLRTNPNPQTLESRETRTPKTEASNPKPQLPTGRQSRQHAGDKDFKSPSLKTTLWSRDQQYPVYRATKPAGARPRRLPGEEASQEP